MTGGIGVAALILTQKISFMLRNSAPICCNAPWVYYLKIR